MACMGKVGGGMNIEEDFQTGCRSLLQKNNYSGISHMKSSQVAINLKIKLPYKWSKKMQKKKKKMKVQH